MPAFACSTSKKRCDAGSFRTTEKRSFPMTRLLGAITLAVILILPSSAMAAPDWSADPHYTHQSWEFNALNHGELNCPPEEGAPDPLSPGIPGRDGDPPLEPDALGEPVINPYGTPYLQKALPQDGDVGAWIYNAMAGPWMFCGQYGGMGDVALFFEIPNPGVLDGLHTEVLVQWTFYASGPDESWSCEIGRNYEEYPGESDPLDRVLITESEGVFLISEEDERITDEIRPTQPTEWHRVTQVWRLGDVPSTLYAKISGMTEGAAVMIDRVAVDTRCVEDVAAPEVVDTEPDDSAVDVRVDTKVSITFTVPMDAAATEDAFGIQPAANGFFAWTNLDKTMTFTPGTDSDPEYLAPEETYTVTLSSDARDAAGIHLEEAYGFTFTTEPYTAPDPVFEGVPEGTVDTDEAGITVGGAGVYRYAYKLDEGEWSEPAGLSEDITLSGLSDGEHSLYIRLEDARMEWTDTDPLSWTVMAPPAVVRTVPEDGGSAPANTAIVVSFNEPMNEDSVRNAFEMEPQAGGVFSWNGTEMTFLPDHGLTPDVTYQVTIRESAADAAGNRLPQDYSWSFTTYEGPATIACPVDADTYILFGGMGGGKGYPKGDSSGRFVAKAGAVTIVDARALFRFDLSGLGNINAEEVVKAEFHYRMLDAGQGDMEMSDPAPAGTPMYGFVHALNTTTYEYTELDREGSLPHPTETLFWGENNMGGANYVDWKNKPGYVRGTPMIVVTHDNGPETNGSIDITEIVKGWVRGEYPNNGIEIKDHDDRSIPDDEWGDGYSWHIASHEASANAPYLSVEVNAVERARITEKPGALPVLAFGETLVLHAEGGDDSNYGWHVRAPDQTDITDEALSAATGDVTTFTAPAWAGLYEIVLSHGSDGDSLFIGVEDPNAYVADEETQALSQELFPLFMGSELGSSEQEAVYHICREIVDDMGTSGMLGEVTLIDADGERRRIGGTGKAYAARTSISIVEDLSKAHVHALTDDEGSTLCAIEIPVGGIPQGAAQKIYSAATDTGISSWANTSRVYDLRICNEGGQRLDAASIDEVVITLRFNREAVQEGQLTDGSTSIVHAEDTGKFFTAEEIDPKDLVPADRILNVNYGDGWVRFSPDHLSTFGLRPEGEALPPPPPEAPADLGGGCFISAATVGGSLPGDLRDLCLLAAGWIDRILP
jgi:hypothetical protein